MNYTKLVTIGNSLKDLLYYSGCFFFRKGHFRYDFVEELSSFTQLSDEIVSFIILKHLVELQDIWMVQLLKNRYLILEALFFLWRHRFFFNKLNRPRYLSFSSKTFPNLSKGSLTQKLTYLIVVPESTIIRQDEIGLAYLELIDIGDGLIRFFLGPFCFL